MYPPKNYKILTDACDAIIGTYECKSMTIQGNPMDLNDDGVSSLDLMKEFNSMPNSMIAVNDRVRVRPAKDYNVPMEINCCLPIQQIDYDKLIKEYCLQPSGDFEQFSFDYSIDESGNITIGISENNSFRSPSDGDWSVDNVMVGTGCPISLKLLPGNGMEAIIKHRYYDFKTSEMVDVNVQLVYERVSYSIN